MKLDLRKQKIIYLALHNSKTNYDIVPIQLYSSKMNGSFYDYYESINAYNTDNPWIQTMFEQHFNCRFVKKSIFMYNI